MIDMIIGAPSMQKWYNSSDDSKSSDEKEGEKTSHLMTQRHLMSPPPTHPHSIARSPTHSVRQRAFLLFSPDILLEKFANLPYHTTGVIYS